MQAPRVIQCRLQVGRLYVISAKRLSTTDAASTQSASYDTRSMSFAKLIERSWQWEAMAR